MQRISTPEILDSDACSPHEVDTSLRDLCRINRWYGGVATSQALIERVVRSSAGTKRFSLLEVAAGFAEAPAIAAEQLARHGITLDVTLLDRAKSHLLPGGRSLVADALALPFRDGAFDMVSCSLFTHHLEPEELVRYVREALRVSRRAVLINDLVRHPLHLALVYAGVLFMRNKISLVDGIASVRRAYIPAEMHEILGSAFPNGSAPRLEISRHYLFRMGVVVWKGKQL